MVRQIRKVIKKNIDRETPIRKGCLSRLEQWQKWGFVLDYDDVSALGKRCIRGHWVMNTVKGKRDIIALVAINNKVVVYLVECKAPDGGNWSKHQQEYAKRFAWIDNVIYEIVTSPAMIDITLERLTGRTDNILNDIKM